MDRNPTPRFPRVLVGSVLGLLLLLGWVAWSHATDYYASTTGCTGSGCVCTQAAPCKSLVTAIKKLTAGDTLFIHGGEYNEDMDYYNWPTPFPSGTDWNNPVRITKVPGDPEVVITGAVSSCTGNLGDSCPTTLFNIPDGQYVIVDNLTFDGRYTSSVVDFAAYGAHHILWDTVTFQNAKGYADPACGSALTGGCGANFYMRGSFNEARNCKSFGSRFSYGIYVSTSDSNTIDGCEIYNNRAFGIQVYTDSGLTSNNHIIRNNYIHDNNTCNCANGIVLYRSANTKIYNNVIANNGTADIGADGGDAIFAGNGVTNLQVWHNTIVGHPLTGLYTFAGVTGQVVNNIIYGNAAGTSRGDTSGLSFTQTYTSNPTFTSDYHLQAGSGAMGYGTPFASQVPRDKDQLLRSTTAPSAGAYEGSGGGGPPPLPAPTQLRILAITNP